MALRELHRSAPGECGLLEDELLPPERSLELEAAVREEEDLRSGPGPGGGDAGFHRRRRGVPSSAVLASVAGWSLGSWRTALIGFFVGGLLGAGVVYGSQALWRRLRGGAEAIAHQRISWFLAEHPDWRIRLYRTPSCFRVAALHRPFQPREPEVSEAFAVRHRPPVRPDVSAAELLSRPPDGEAVANRDRAAHEATARRLACAARATPGTPGVDRGVRAACAGVFGVPAPGRARLRTRGLRRVRCGRPPRCRVASALGTAHRLNFSPSLPGPGRWVRWAPPAARVRCAAGRPPGGP